MYYFYVLQRPKSEQPYFGFTTDLRQRFKGHQQYRHHNWKLVYYEAYLNEQDARDSERQMKDYGNARTYLKRRIRRCIVEGLEGAGRGVEPKSP
jgi:predicted GIY-YIG superfamily endonuclease